MARSSIAMLMAGANWDRFRVEIRKRMLELGYKSLDQVAKEMEVSPGSLRNWLRDPGKLRMEDFVKLMDVLKLEEDARIWYFSEAVEQLQREQFAS